MLDPETTFSETTMCSTGGKAEARDPRSTRASLANFQPDESKDGLGLIAHMIAWLRSRRSTAAGLQHP